MNVDVVADVGCSLSFVCLFCLFGLFVYVFVCFCLTSSVNVVLIRKSLPFCASGCFFLGDFPVLRCGTCLFSFHSCLLATFVCAFCCLSV